MNVLLTSTFMEWITDAARCARSSIYVSSYTLSPPSVLGRSPLAAFLNLLAKRAAEGLDVKLIGDGTGASGALRPMNQQAKDELLAMGIPTRLSKVAHRHHAKFYIIDELLVAVGSHNLSSNAFVHNIEASIGSDDKALAEELAWMFRMIWEASCV